MSFQDDEKQNVTHVEEVGAVSPSNISVDEVYTLEEQKSIIYRIDRRLVTTCGIMYCISLMDRTNLSAAAIAGMNEDLMLINFRYSTVILVFFITYVLFQPPATVLVRKLGPRNFLSSITLFWGSTMIGFGFVKNWHTLLGLRILLGVLEAGFFPGSVYLLSTWYARYDVQKRYSVFYLIGCLASALSGILAFGFMQMAGLQHLNGWRWIFIMEGILSCLIAIIGFIFLVDFPEKAYKAWGFLNESECAYIIRRINKDRGDALPEAFTLGKFLRPALDLKVWGFGLIFCCSTTVTYAIAYFLPIILREGMGYSVGASQCLVAPPYVLAGIVMYGTAWWGDKYHMRGPVVAVNALIALIGLPIMGFHKNNAVRYFGIFLVTAGANANVPAALAYQSNNIVGQWKRAFCSASLVGMGGIGGIAGSTVFRSQDAPAYHPGIYAAITANCLILLTVGLLSIHFTMSNKKARRGQKIIEGQPGFLYTI